MQRHEVGHAHPAAIDFELGAQHQGILLVMALHLVWRLFGGDLPEAMLLGAQQLGETGGGVEAWWAEPVDTAVAPDQGGAAQIAKQSIVLDGLGHGRLPAGVGIQRFFSSNSASGNSTAPAMTPVTLPRCMVSHSWPL